MYIYGYVGIIGAHEDLCPGGAGFSSNEETVILEGQPYQQYSVDLHSLKNQFCLTATINYEITKKSLML